MPKLTATETFRAMLDERGVKWEAFDDFEQTTQWSTYNGAFVYWARERDGKLLVETTAPTKCSASCTPEQAIAATLGRDNAGRYVGLRQGKYWERTENSDYYCGGCGWKVTDHNSYCPECGGALHKAALDSSSCTNSEQTSDELLPCPFCGGEAEIVHTPKVIPYEPWWIRCSFCEATTPKYKSETAKADAIAAWNRRAEHD